MGIANIDTDSSPSLINNRLAYVAISRASQDARIYTNDAETLGARLATDVTKTAALDFTTKVEQAEAAPPSKTPKVVQVHEYNNSDSRLGAVASEYVTRTRESRTYQEEIREIAQGERIRFTSSISYVQTCDANQVC